LRVSIAVRERGPLRTGVSSECGIEKKANVADAALARCLKGACDGLRRSRKL
jgi:hypothetical protein